MRFLMFLTSSSLLICLVLLIRRLFRKKLAPGAVYALWLIPLLRLLIPFGVWELPVFGIGADIFNTPYALVTEWMDREYAPQNTVSDTEPEKAQIQMANELVPTGTKVFDAVTPETDKQPEGKQDFTEPVQREEKASSIEEYQLFLSGLWLAGSMALGVYVISKNRKLNRSIEEMEPAEVLEGVTICVGDEISVPCLAGFRHPRILVPREIYDDNQLYKCVLQHELAHFHQKDHLWTAVKILICVIYWWNPLVWIGAICAEEDAELACDARALKGQRTEECRAYGYALLQMLGNAEQRNQHLCAATSMSGGKKSMKRRIEEISQRTSTKAYVLLPVTLILAAALIFGCGLPTDKSWMRTKAWDESTYENGWFSELEFEYALQEDIQSRLLYYEIYHYGNLSERHIVLYGDVGEGMPSSRRCTVKLGLETREKEQILKWDADDLGLETKIQISRYVGMGGGGSLFLNDKQKLEIKPGDDLILIQDNQPAHGEEIGGYSCEEMSEMTEQELQDCLKDDYLTTLVRIVFSDLPEEELSKLYTEQEYPGEIFVEAGQSTVLATKWADAFADKDAASLIQLAGDEVRRQLTGEGLLDEEILHFGWSSPWPMFTEQLYEILSCDDTGAEIVYYATDSTPHVWVWRETLGFEEIDGGLKVTSEQLRTFDWITNAEELSAAYSEGIEGTMMDYTVNGLGEALNNNALRDVSEQKEQEAPGNSVYQQLFSPETAAAELLNIKMDEELVSYSWEDTKGTATVQVYFLRDNGDADIREIIMWQPYGEDGIWIPKEISGTGSVASRN